MDNVRVTVQTAGSIPSESISPSFEAVDGAIEEWWKKFFVPSVESLKENVMAFFAEHNKSPFPVVAHVIPPQDEIDSAPFVQMLTKLYITFVDKKLHHIQQDKLILFHTSSPPSNVPRVLTIFTCYDSSLLFDQFVDDILRILFGFGITPDNSFVGMFRSLFFDKYHSFSYLLTILRQSIMTHMLNCKQDQLSKVLDVNPIPYFDKFMKQPMNTDRLPTAVIIKTRVYAMDLAAELFNKNGMKQQRLFNGINNFDDFWKNSQFTKLLNYLKEMDQEELKTYLQQEANELCPLFASELAEIEAGGKPEPAKPTVAKSRRSRQMALLGNKTDEKKAVSIFENFLNKVFRPIPEKSVCLFLLSDIATFNPRNALVQMLSDEKSKNDTAVAYQILMEQESRTVNSVDWLNAFSAKIHIKKFKKGKTEDDKALTLSRFQVAVSELEYLGFIDKRTRVPGAFRHILRV